MFDLFRPRPEARSVPGVPVPGVSGVPGVPGVDVEPAGSLADLHAVFLVRDAVYVRGQNCPVEEEYDGNDFCASHLVARLDGVVAGTLRLRWFADVMKIERLAVLERFRGRGVGRALVRRALEIGAGKGYARVVADAQEQRITFWESLGFSAVGARRFQFSDHGFLRMGRAVATRGSVLDHPDPMRANRPEGAWDRPGVLERPDASPGTLVEAA